MALDSVQGCRICFTTERKLYSMITHKILYLAYEKISGLLINNEEPLYLCPDCTRQLLVCVHFRKIIREIHAVLLKSAKNFGPLTIELLQSARANLGSKERLGFQNDDLDIQLIGEQNVRTADDIEIKDLLDEAAAITFIKVERNDKDDDHNYKMNHGFNIARSDSHGEVCTDVSPEDMHYNDVGLENIVIKQEIVSIEDTSNVSENMQTITVSNDIAVSGIKVEKNHEEDQELNDPDSALNDGSVCIEWQEVDTTDHEGKLKKNYVMIQESVDRELNNAIVELKKPLEGDSDSSNDSLPLAEARGRTAFKRASEPIRDLPKDPEQAQSDSQRNTGSGCGYVINYRLTCGLCPFGTNNELRWRGHMKAHAAKEKFNCELCSYITTNKSRLVSHYEVHAGEKSYVCDICDMAFHRKHNLDVHIRKHFEIKPYRCNVCKKTFTEKRILDNHKRNHSGERPFSCTECDKAFTNKSSLRKHLYIHSDQKPFKCDVCSKSFTAKAYMRMHMRLHTGEKPFSCPVCNKLFNRKNHLQQHMGRHTEDKPHACHVCDKAFVNASRLRVHVNSHTGDKPYNCTYCEKTFKTKGNAKSHMLRHNRTDKKKE